MLPSCKLRHTLVWAYRKNLEDLLWMARAGLFRYLKEPRRKVEHQPVIFVFHSVSRERFERQLRFLSENGYRTLKAGELTYTGRMPPRSVVLTFDDARLSLWNVGYPLLRLFGFSATAFVVPGCVPETEVGQGDQGGRERALCTWKQLDVMAGSGVVEFQSHTHRHLLVEVEPVLIGFLTPWMIGREFANTHLPYRVRRILEQRGAEGALGTPIFASMPLLYTRRMLRVSQRVTERCIEFVRRSGGVGFFRNPGWQKSLRRRYQEAVRKEESPFYWTDVEPLVRRELSQAKWILEERFGSPVEQLCLPWFGASRETLRLIRECGYRTVHWGAQPAAWPIRIREGLRNLWRVDECFLEALPGDGSLTISEIIRARFRKALDDWRRNRRTA